MLNLCMVLATMYIYIYIHTIQRHFEVFKKEATLCHFNQSRRLYRIWMHRRCELMILCLVTAPPFILAKQSGRFRQFINRLDGMGRGAGDVEQREPCLLDLPWSCQPLLHLHSPTSIFLHLIGLRPVRIQFVAQTTSPPESQSWGSLFSTFANATVYIYIY